MQSRKSKHSQRAAHIKMDLHRENFHRSAIKYLRFQEDQNNVRGPQHESPELESKDHLSMTRIEIDNAPAIQRTTSWKHGQNQASQILQRARDKRYEKAEHNWDKVACKNRQNTANQIERGVLQNIENNPNKVRSKILTWLVNNGGGDAKWAHSKGKKGSNESNKLQQYDPILENMLNWATK